MLSEIAYYFALSSFLVFSLFLFTVILFQEGRAGSIGSPFKNDSDSVFGTSTNDVMNKIISWSIGIFLFSCIGLSVWTSKLGKQRPRPQVNQELPDKL